MFEAIREAIEIFKRVKPEETIWVQVSAAEWIEIPRRYCQMEVPKEARDD